MATDTRQDAMVQAAWGHAQEALRRRTRDSPEEREAILQWPMADGVALGHRLDRPARRREVLVPAIRCYEAAASESETLLIGNSLDADSALAMVISTSTIVSSSGTAILILTTFGGFGTLDSAAFAAASDSDLALDGRGGDGVWALRGGAIRGLARRGARLPPIRPLRHRCPIPIARPSLSRRQRFCFT